jgi:hypothetical protein
VFAIVAGQIGAKSAELAEAQLAALDALGSGNLVLPADPTRRRRDPGGDRGAGDRPWP